MAALAIAIVGTIVTVAKAGYEYSQAQQQRMAEEEMIEAHKKYIGEAKETTETEGQTMLTRAGEDIEKARGNIEAGLAARGVVGGASASAIHAEIEKTKQEWQDDIRAETDKIMKELDLAEEDLAYQANLSDINARLAGTRAVFGGLEGIAGSVFAGLNYDYARRGITPTTTRTRLGSSAEALFK